MPCKIPRLERLFVSDGEEFYLRNIPGIIGQQLEIKNEIY